MEAPVTPIIELENVDFGYTPGELTLENVDLKISAGESGCIVGPNGGGKSTLLKLLLGLLEPSRGTVKLFGLRPEEGRRRVGYMPQYHLLDPVFPITAREVVLSGRIRSWRPFWFGKEDRLAAERAMREIGISHLAGRKFSSLSGGQRQLRVEVKTADPLRRDVLRNIQELVSELRMAFAEYDSK